MRQELRDKFQTTFPTFFRQAYSVPGVDEGWAGLVWELCEALQALNPPSDFEVVQVKEKFGSMRFYVDGGTKQIYEAIEAAERKSALTCEVCGQEGKLRKSGWWKTLCDQHHKERER